MAKPVKVKITYCAECGYEGQTIELTERLMKQFGQELSAIEIIPWFQGSFDVRDLGRRARRVLEKTAKPTEPEQLF